VKLPSIFSRVKGLLMRVASLPLLKNPRVRRAVKWVAVAATAILLVWIIVRVWGLMDRSVQQLFLLLIAVAIVLLWFLKGLPGLERRQALRRVRGDLTAGDPAAEQLPRALLLDALRQTKQVLERSPEVDRKHDPLYAIPWFMILGDERAAATEFLRAASATSPFPAPARSANAGQYWHWWLYRRLIAIEADPRWVCDSQDKTTRGIWYHALQHLHAERRGMPLNGVVVLVSRDTLMEDGQAVRDHALHLRRLIDECLEHLQLIAPVYVVVTGIERVPGYDAFARNLAPDVLRQAMGHRLEAAKRTDADSWLEFSRIFQHMLHRLHQVRLAAIRRDPDPMRRRGVWDFVEGMRQLAPNLSLVIKTLVEDNPYQRTPQWRGLYFAATSGKGAFIEDLFTRFLPADQPLAARTRQPGLKRWLGGLVSVGLVAALTGLVTYQASTAMSENRRLREVVKTACEGLSSGRTDLPSLATCVQDLATVEEVEARVGLTWGISGYRQDLADKKKLLLTEFKTVLDAYDSRFENDINGRVTGFDHLVAATQRVELAERCRRASRCMLLDGEPNLLFDPSSRLYSSLSGHVSKDPGARDADASSLLALYLAYLRWVPDSDNALLTKELEKAKSYLTAAQRRPVRTEDIVAWAEVRNERIAADAMWGLSAQSKQKVDAPSVGVPAAYTRPVWEHVLMPAIDRMAERDAALELREAYFHAYFEAWRDFLAGFGSLNQRIGKADIDPLVAKAIQGESPYIQLWQLVREHLFTLPVTVDTSDRFALFWASTTANWLGTLGHAWTFLRDSLAEKKNATRPPTWLLALRHTLEGEWKRAPKKMMPFWAALEADSTGENSLHVAREIFRSDGQQPEEFAELSSIVETVPSRYKSEMRGADLSAWRAVSGEVQLLLTLIGQRALVKVEDDWRQRVLPDIRRQSTMDPAALQRGIQQFSETTLADFLDKSGGLKEVLGTRLPLSPGFQSLVAEQGTGAVPVSDGRPTRLATIELVQPSTFGMTREGPAGTLIEITCGSERFSVSSKGASKFERQVAIVAAPDSCLAARITIALPDFEMDPLASGPRLDPTQRSVTKTYSDDVLRKMSEDFKSGARNFSLADFQGAYSQEEWSILSQYLRMLAINQARVFANVALSGEMERRLGTRLSVESLPGNLSE